MFGAGRKISSGGIINQPKEDLKFLQKWVNNALKEIWLLCLSKAEYSHRLISSAFIKIYGQKNKCRR